MSLSAVADDLDTVEIVADIAIDFLLTGKSLEWILHFGHKHHPVFQDKPKRKLRLATYTHWPTSKTMFYNLPAVRVKEK